MNPVPPTRTNSSRQCNSGKTKCLASSKTIAINHRAVPCDVCKRKTLIKCGDIAPKMYDRMINVRICSEHALVVFIMLVQILPHEFWRTHNESPLCLYDVLETRFATKGL